ncbi:MAG TPA: MFS transporter [Candidatus Binatia bacterium]|nr:MFS transporter [Candidatus Binatia bacterium]
MTGKKSRAKEPLDTSQLPGDTGPFWPHLGPVFFLTAIFLINFIARIILSPLLPTIEKDLGISHTQAGSFFFLIATGYITGLLGSGFIASRSTHKITIVISTAGVGLALLGISVASGLQPMRLGLFGLGFASGLYIASAIATITSLIERPHWGKAIGVHEVAPNLAFFAGPFVAELFLRGSSWRVALSFLGIASLIASFVYLRMGRGGEFAGASPASGAFCLLVQSASFWILTALFGLGISATIGVYAMLPLYLVIERGIDLSWANTVVALSRSYGPILGLIGGWVSDRLGPKQTLVTSLLFTGLATLLLGLVSRVWINTVVLIQPLLAVWFFPAAFAALAATMPPAARNLAVAFTIPVGYLIGAGAIPTFIGIMGDAESFGRGFIVTGILILAGGLLAWLLRLPQAPKSS